MPNISVITTAYKHEKTLDRAVQSVRRQTVKVEHIIIDDTETKNGMMETFRQAFQQCTGKYIAFCDGDDYYIDKYKLFRQLVYMEANPDCGLCTTKVFNMRNGEWWEETEKSIDEINRNMTFDNLLKGKANIHAQSYFIRKSVFDKYIDFDYFAKNFNLWDLPIVLELIQHTKFHCLDFYSAVNVINDESVTHTRSRIKRIKYIYGQFKIKWHYIRKYGCKFSTYLYLIYRIVRHIYSIGFKRWK